jgi:hypothetical protein
VEIQASSEFPHDEPTRNPWNLDFTHYYGLLAFAVRNAGKQLYDPSFDKLSEAVLLYQLWKSVYVVGDHTYAAA